MVITVFRNLGVSIDVSNYSLKVIFGFFIKRTAVCFDLSLTKHSFEKQIDILTNTHTMHVKGQ